MNDQNALIREWEQLQSHVEASERQALHLKVVAVILGAAAMLFGDQYALLGVVLMAILWLQNAIWTTFQERMSTRLLRVENAIARREDIAPFQLNASWQAQRPGLAGLLFEYLKQALRPTVAFPYPVLMLVLVVSWYYC